jgi:integrase
VAAGGEDRDKTLWRLLYETAARAGEALALDVTDLDPTNKRARVIGQGGDTDWVYYQTGTALLLPRLLGGRTRGPVLRNNPIVRGSRGVYPGGRHCAGQGVSRCGGRPSRQ